MLLAAKVGDPPERWFSQTRLSWSYRDFRYAALARYLTRGSGGAIPTPEHVPPERVDIVLEWLAGTRPPAALPS